MLSAERPAENTYCPACGELLIKRTALMAAESRLRDAACPECGRVLPGK
ncbi:MAG: hypothetical protein KAX19_14110 [Candidatus Brocadiae bacterium]|nr:hypothetical protein [Candidatus Brocadiia bacterium]